MKLKHRMAAALAAVSMATASPAAADLIGTSVSGSLTASGALGNLFDPNLDSDPNWGNFASPNNVVISASQVEFGFAELGGVDTITADFTGNAVDIFFFLGHGGEYGAAFTLQFTDTAFLGLTVNPMGMSSLTSTVTIHAGFTRS